MKCRRAALLLLVMPLLVNQACVCMAELGSAANNPAGALGNLNPPCILPTWPHPSCLTYVLVATLLRAA